MSTADPSPSSSSSSSSSSSYSLSAACIHRQIYQCNDAPSLRLPHHTPPTTLDIVPRSLADCVINFFFFFFFFFFYLLFLYSKPPSIPTCFGPFHFNRRSNFESKERVYIVAPPSTPPSTPPSAFANLLIQRIFLLGWMGGGWRIGICVLGLRFGWGLGGCVATVGKGCEGNVLGVNDIGAKSGLNPRSEGCSNEGVTNPINLVPRE